MRRRSPGRLFAWAAVLLLVGVVMTAWVPLMRESIEQQQWAAVRRVNLQRAARVELAQGLQHLLLATPEGPWRRAEGLARLDAAMRALSEVQPLDAAWATEQRAFLEALDAARAQSPASPATLASVRVHGAALERLAENGDRVLREELTAEATRQVNSLMATLTVMGALFFVGGVAFLLAAMRQRRSDEALQLSERALVQAQKQELLGQLAGGIAHDFNNLLVVVHSGAQFLQEMGPDPERTQVAKEIVEAAEKASALTKQLLAFSRRREFSSAQLDLRDVVGSMARLTRRLLPSNVTIDVKLPETPAAVMGDRALLEQLLLNLVVNARDAMGNAGGRIEVTVVQEPSAVVLRVRDEGEGIAPEHRERLFELFFTTKPEGKGTGLGLATVKRVAEQHHARVEVDSTPGHGATFSVWFPATAKS